MRTAGYEMGEGKVFAGGGAVRAVFEIRRGTMAGEKIADAVEWEDGSVTVEPSAGRLPRVNFGSIDIALHHFAGRHQSIWFNVVHRDPPL